MNVSATLRSSDNRFRITDSVTSFGDIPACSTCINTSDAFAIEVDQTIPMETSIPCYLFIMGDSICDTFSFRIVVGEIRMIDPIPDNQQPPLYWAYDNVDTNYSNHPGFEWIECYGIGTQVVLGDDETQTVDLPAGFVWNYYGQSYSQISICSNGWVASGYTTVQSYFNYCLPGSSAPANMVAVNWDDMDPRTGNGVWYYSEPLKHCFVVEWDSVPYYATSTPEKFQVIIYDTTVHTPTGNNVIVTQYATANGFTSSTIGIQDLTQTIGIQCLFDTSMHRGMTPIAPNRAIKFITADPTVGIETRPSTGSGVKSGIMIKVFPNPFREKVTFALNAPSTLKTTVRIYDNTGRLVRSLASCSMTSFTWDGRDNDDKEVRAGIYFLRVDNPGNLSITKLILMR